MRNNIKENILELIQTLYEAHSNVETLIKEKDNQSVCALLEDCQNAAIHIGESIEQSEGENFITVKYLEAYCELLYTTSVNISNGIYEKIKENLNAQLHVIEDSVRDDIKGKWEIVFLPYKVSMWDSLESIWKRAFEDDDFDTYVVPIPYYDRNPDRTFGEYHYEGKLFPADVPITHYEDYNFAERMPDAIFIHNPYDLGNLVTSVEPKFYSNILKNYTNLLIYIPYFLFPKEPQTHLIDTFALENVDSIFVQNEEVKEAYVNQAKIVGNEKVLEKVFAVGSPKIDKICEICKDGIPVPDIWKRVDTIYSGLLFFLIICSVYNIKLGKNLDFT